MRKQLVTYTRRTSIARSLVVVAALASTVSAAQAQIIDCPGLSTVSGYKVLLDDITFLSEQPVPPANLNAIMARLRFKLETALQELRLDPSVELKVLRCEGRQPRGERDFDHALVQVLDSRDVVLELWGSVLPSEPAGCEALVGYALIPVRSRERGAAGISGVYETMYQSSLTAPASRLLDLFKDAHELQAFSALSLGLNQLRAKRYDLARSFLCRAEILLRRRRPAGDMLVQYVGRLGVEVVASARHDQSYKGLLRAPQIGGCDAGQ